MHCHCGTNNRAPRWTFTDPCKPEVRPGVLRECVIRIPSVSWKATNWGGVSESPYKKIGPKSVLGWARIINLRNVYGIGSRSYHWIFTEITYMGTWNKFLECVSTFTFNSLSWFCKLAPSAHIRYFGENSMIARAALIMKDTFAPRFASIQWILDSVEFLEYSEVILAKFSSSCVYMLSLS